MDIKEIADRAIAARDEFNLLKKAMKEYAGEHPKEVDAVDDAYIRKAYNFPGDITLARIARVSHKIAYPK